MKVFSFGNANVDMIYYVNQIPGPDEQCEAYKVEIYPGGSAANFAVALAVLGLKTHFIGRVGDDWYAEFLLKSYARKGVIVDYVKKVKGMTGRAIIIVDLKGNRAMVALRGVNLTLCLEDLEKVLYGEGHLHISGIRAALAAEALTFAKENELTTSYDPGGLAVREKEVKTALTNADIVFLNEKELSFLRKVGVGLSDITRSSKVVVVKMGKRGARAYSRGRKYDVPAIKTKAIDTTGAGDVFNAGFVYSWLKGSSVKECLTLGNALAALKVGRRGAQSLPSKEEIEGFFERLGLKLSLG